MTEGGTFNERGRRATMSEIAAEDRRTANRPSEGVSTRPTDSSGRRASDADLGMTTSAKKAVGPSSVAVSKVLAGMTKPMKKAVGGSVNKPMESTPAPRTNETDAEYEAKMVALGKFNEKNYGKKPPVKGTAKVGNPLTKGPGPRPAVPSPATAKPKIGALAAGARQLMDKMKGTSKPTVTAPRTSTRDIETDDGRRAPNAVKTPTTSNSNTYAMSDTGRRPSVDPTGRSRVPSKLAPTQVPPIAAPTTRPTPVAPVEPVTRRPTITTGGTPLEPGYSKGGSAKKGVPAHNSRPMIGRRAGGLAVMPRGKC